MKYMKTSEFRVDYRKLINITDLAHAKFIIYVGVRGSNDEGKIDRRTARQPYGRTNRQPYGRTNGLSGS